MTRTTFKALWVGGGGVLATWLAVSPNPVCRQRRLRRRTGAPRRRAGPAAEELNAQADAAARPHRRSDASSVDAKSFQIQLTEIRRAIERRARARCSIAGNRIRRFRLPPPGPALTTVGNRAESGNAHGDHLVGGADLSGRRRRLSRGPLHRRRRLIRKPFSFAMTQAPNSA